MSTFLQSSTLVSREESSPTDGPRELYEPLANQTTLLFTATPITPTTDRVLNSLPSL